MSGLLFAPIGTHHRHYSDAYINHSNLMFPVLTTRACLSTSVFDITAKSSALPPERPVGVSGGKLAAGQCHALDAAYASELFIAPVVYF